MLAPFKAAGRTAFSLYFLQQFIAIYILFAPWGPGLWGKLSWSGLYGVALAVLATMLVPAGSEITEDHVPRVENSGLEKIRIRSVLTCGTRRGVCINELTIDVLPPRISRVAGDRDVTVRK